MKARLYVVEGKNRYCGPTAIATILGITTDEAAILICRQSGARFAKLTHTSHVINALRAVGCRVRYFAAPHRWQDQPIVSDWLRGQHKKLPKDKQIVLVHGHHFGTLLGRRYLCSLTRRETVAFKDIPRINSRVEGWFVVESLPEKQVVVAAPVRKADPERGARRKAKALAALHDIEIEVESGSDGSVIVWGLKDLPDAEDPHEGDHYANGWVDALERVQEYADISVRKKVAAEKVAGTKNTLEHA